MTADDANQYIGLPWRLGARGPSEYDCRGLLVHCRSTYFGGGIPDFELGDAARDLYAHKMRSGEWQIVAIPEHGDGVLLRDGNDPHVGIYLDLDGGGVLHALEGKGVVFTALRDLNFLGFARPTFYRIHA
ncbi:C40 family peptidase [Alcaligenes faecalis subsp. faecalis]|uniref:NlpC/P60 family protein n=1 Tax=Alcaligenes faecalis TaxID=511 RepID=UPI001F43D3AB|nr:NlpC/P60 family protein [Alcaligenes faecalis]MBW4789115.1 C40 family peptidase [Alcaligenes faecalis subsp. faecalis]